MKIEKIQEAIELEAKTLPKTYPLYGFVTSNPLQGLEDLHFEDAVEEGERLFGGRGYPPTEAFKEAWISGAIDEELLKQHLEKAGLPSEPELSLRKMERQEERSNENESLDLLNRIMIKWLSVFMDQGTSEIGDEEIPASIEEKTAIAKATFQLLGWDDFSPLIVFVGHGSETANNPFASSLDCGACAGNKGRYNARALAAICNERNVQLLLEKEHDIRIPEETVFLAGEHNTTTDDVLVFDDLIPEGKEKLVQKPLERLQENLQKAGKWVAAERVGNDRAMNPVKKVRQKAHDWAETRPEWGLAGNAGFLIAPRSLTKEVNFEGRCFLHEYDPEKDPEGEALEAVMNGPMVVTQWINSHYYFSTVDNRVYGSGPKITQNPKGKHGVVQGNGGDLKYGLPLESVFQNDHIPQHSPLRLTVLVYAPRERVETILDRLPPPLLKLMENEWLHFGVLEPGPDPFKKDPVYIKKAKLGMAEV